MKNLLLLAFLAGCGGVEPSQEGDASTDACGYGASEFTKTIDGGGLTCTTTYKADCTESTRCVASKGAP